MEAIFEGYGSVFTEKLFETTSDVVFVKDPRGAYIFVNKAFECLYGYTLAQVRHKTDFDFLPEPEAQYFANRDQEAIRAGKPTVSEAAQVNELTGTTEHFETIKTPVFDKDGQLIGLLGIGRNVTQRKNAEDALLAANQSLEARVVERTRELATANERIQQALEHLNLTQHELVQGEKLASLGRLVAGLSHELNTPIGSAYTVASTLIDHARSMQSKFDSGKIKRSEMAVFIQNALHGASLVESTLRHANELIGNFKQVSVDQASSRRREFDLASTVDEVLSALAVSFKGSGIQLVSSVPRQIILDSFPGMLTQILINVIDNARAHAFEPGSAGTVKISARDLGALVELAVQDNGIGIAKELQGKVFDPFFTTRLGTGGSGIGLSIVHSLVTQGLEGSVRLKSAAGAGCKFTFVIPKSVTRAAGPSQ